MFYWTRTGNEKILNIFFFELESKIERIITMLFCLRIVEQNFSPSCCNLWSDSAAPSGLRILIPFSQAKIASFIFSVRTSPSKSFLILTNC